MQFEPLTFFDRIKLCSPRFWSMNNKYNSLLDDFFIKAAENDLIFYSKSSYEHLYIGSFKIWTGNYPYAYASTKDPVFEISSIKKVLAGRPKRSTILKLRKIEKAFEKTHKPIHNTDEILNYYVKDYLKKEKSNAL